MSFYNKDRFYHQLQKRGFRNIDALDPNDNMLNKARERDIYRSHIVDFLGKQNIDIETGIDSILVISLCEE